MTTITFKTIKGATVELTDVDNTIEARVVGNDKMHFMRVEIHETAALGVYVDCGPIKAQVSHGDIETVRAFFAARDCRLAEWLENHKPAQWETSMELQSRMGRADSDL